ncbi:ECA1 gametogenesis related family protein [Arabidopsis thaliana]|uniref:ECA1 gametogenesis related family protein n=1 Tax=Arabidopsis thaliana TaxID=3702 RepID=A8MQ80_ARATH|nr:ECA1 gametogenesis related family protein [Arabidopsis thaliana]AED94881.1 ECA1 gametogenesis related family protein [Arabidopsis thaliana]|eukprot:NP_001078696.1 ECA1 gametogenesis related family protein [Arabidopsis thaliana]
MSIKNVLSLLAVLCIIVSVNAQLPQIPGPFPFPFPFQPIPGMPGLLDITKCLSSVMDIPRCITEISQSIFIGKFGNLGPACCKAFLDAEANCMPKIPFIPLFPPMLKEQCSRIAGATPPTPK